MIQLTVTHRQKEIYEHHSTCSEKENNRIIIFLLKLKKTSRINTKIKRKTQKKGYWLPNQQSSKTMQAPTSPSSHASLQKKRQ